MELMELQFKVLKEQEEKIAQVENKVDKLEEDMPLFQIDTSISEKERYRSFRCIQEHSLQW